MSAAITLTLICLLAVPVTFLADRFELWWVERLLGEPTYESVSRGIRLREALLGSRSWNGDQP